MRAAHALRPVLAVALGVAAVLASAPARASGAIVIEAYVGDRPADAERFVGPVLDELQRRGVVGGPSRLGRAYEERISASAVGVDEATLAWLEDLASTGYQAFIEARFDDAVEILGRVVRDAEAAPARLGGELRVAYRQALIGLALARSRLGQQADALAAMYELRRSFPDQPVQRAEFGPEAVELEKKARTALAKMGTGSLVVVVDDPDAGVFVNETYAGGGEVTMSGLVPGVYRVMVRAGKSTGRVYRVRVDAGVTARVEVDWAFDRALRTSPVWCGFSYPDDATRNRLLSEHAVRLARAVGAESAVVVTIGSSGARRAIVGTVVAPDAGKPARADVALEPEPSERRLRALGAFLSGEEGALRAVEAEEAVRAPMATPAAEGRGGRSGRWLGASLVVGGVAVALGGGYLVAIDGDPYGSCAGLGVTCPEVWDTKRMGVALLVTGGLAVAGGAYVWWRRPGARSGGAGTRLSVSISPGTAGLAFSGEY